MDDASKLDSTPPTAQTLLRLHQRGILDPPALRRALALAFPAPSRARWEAFLGILLLVLGAGYLVSGIYFFFAYNWASLPPFAKLGLLEALVAAAVGVACWRGLDRPAGKIALSAAALLVGALVALCGQLYQTGADSYELFLYWALLIAGWVLLSRFTPLWLVWMALLNLSILLYWWQVMGGQGAQIYLMLFVPNLLALLAWEIGHARRLSWLSSRWAPRLLAIPIFLALTSASLELVLGFSWPSEPEFKARQGWLLAMLVLLILTSAGVLYRYSRRTLDLFMLTLCAACLLAVLDTWMGHQMGAWRSGTFFLMGVLLIIEAVSVVAWLRSTAEAWEAHSV